MKIAFQATFFLICFTGGDTWPASFALDIKHHRFLWKRNRHSLCDAMFMHTSRLSIFVPGSMPAHTEIGVRAEALSL